ncbi:MAG: hypothetical protein A2X12_05040 [Bacteroidetes bacterium GWE2_29_8]|nr:MAG: hypothetical protein A2X12_05040 [Bacteroidetes bacterium GWE2_29_8]
MEGHKRQAISSQFVFEKTFKGQEYLGSYPSMAEATFQHLLHKILLRQTRVVYASHNFKLELPL